MKKFGWMILVAGLVAGGVLTTGALAQKVGGGRGALRQRLAERLHGRAEKLREVGRALALTPAQSEQALGIAHAAEPLAREVRKQVARGLVDAPRSGERAVQRERVRELVQNAFRTLEPQLRELVASLSPEQRARLEALARRHGRTLDDERLVKRLAFLLSRPMAAPLLEARLGR